MSAHEGAGTQLGGFDGELNTTPCVSRSRKLIYEIGDRVSIDGHLGNVARFEYGSDGVLHAYVELDNGGHCELNPRYEYRRGFDDDKPCTYIVSRENLSDYGNLPGKTLKDCVSKFPPAGFTAPEPVFQAMDDANARARVAGPPPGMNPFNPNPVHGHITMRVDVKNPAAFRRYMGQLGYATFDDLPPPIPLPQRTHVTTYSRVRCAILLVLGSVTLVAAFVFVYTVLKRASAGVME